MNQRTSIRDVVYPHAEVEWPDKKPFMEELNREMQRGSDRALVLVCGAMIDEQLRRLLEAAFHYSSAKLFEGPSAPVAPMASRIDIARALGLVAEEDKLRLHHLRRMRNDMAHQLSLDLSDRRFLEGIDKLLFGINLKNIDDNCRLRFSVAAIYLINMLGLRIVEARRRKSTPLF